MASNAYQQWQLSLSDTQIGVFPLAPPASSLTFPFRNGSLSDTYRALRAGTVFPVSLPLNSLDAKLTLSEHWNWLLANRQDGMDLRLALGFVSANHNKIRLPIFTSNVDTGNGIPEPGFLHQKNGEKLALNTSLVRLLKLKFSLPTHWVKGKPEAPGLDGILEALEEALSASPLKSKMKVEREAAVGLSANNWSVLSADLKAHQSAYLQSRLVNLYGKAGKPTRATTEATTTSPLAEDLYAPVKADQYQLQVPRLFGQGESFILSGAPATGKTDAVVNSLAQAVVNQRSTLVVGSRTSLTKLHDRVGKAGFEHLFLCLDSRPELRDDRAANVLREAWDRPVNADSAYLESCRASLETLSQDLNLYLRQIHETGPHQVSAWQAYTAQLLTGANLEPEERVMAGKLASSPNFPYRSKDRSAAAKLGTKLADLDANSVNGIGGNSWSLVGEDATKVDRTALAVGLKALEQSITQAHPAVLEIMSACTDLECWPVFARWLDLLENGYGRSPVELTERERIQITSSIEGLKTAFTSLLEESQPLLDLALPAYQAGKDLDLLMDARHAETSGSLTRNSRRKAVLNQLQPYLNLAVTPNKVLNLLEDLNALRMRAEALGTRIGANPVLGLRGFDPLGENAEEKFFNHADTVITAVELFRYLPNRLEDLESLMPIAREGGHLGKQARSIAAAFADVLQALHATPETLDKWRKGLPPLGRYLQIRKTWNAEIETQDSTLDDILSFRELSPKLKSLGLDQLVEWVQDGQLHGMTIAGVLEHALSVGAVRDRQRSLEQLGYTPDSHAGLVERLSLNVSETRREILNHVIAGAGGFAAKTDKEVLRHFGSLLRSQGFSIQETLSQELPGVLTRTPIVGLTPQEVITHLSVSAKPQFDAVIVLDADTLPSGAVIKALASADQVMLVATLPAATNFAHGKAVSAYQQARSAGIPELQFRVRYGTNLSETPDFLAAHLQLPDLVTWPVPQITNHPVSITEMPAPLRALPLLPRHENSGWIGKGADYDWYAKAGNLLMNLSLKTRSKHITAMTWTSELAAGIRWYLNAANDQESINLSNLQVTHLGAGTNVIRAENDRPGLLTGKGGYADGMPGETDLLVFFLGSQNQPAASKSGAVVHLNAAVKRALLSANQQVLLVKNSDLDPTSLPEIFQEVLVPPGSGQSDSSGKPYNNAVSDYLARLLSRAGLEVRHNFSESPVPINLAVRGAPGAPWLGLVLDAPEFLEIPNAIDREVGMPQFLLDECGFGALEHIYLAQLMENTDEVTRRIVSIALDLAFPGDVTDGAVASEDRYTSPARIAAAQDSRGDGHWETPGPESWKLPLPLTVSPSDPSAETKPKIEGKPVPAGVVKTRLVSEPRRAQATAPATKPATNVAQATVARKPVLQDSNARIEDIPPAVQRKTSAAIPVISDIPADTFTHLGRDQIAADSQAPTLADQLSTEETSIFIDLARQPGEEKELGKISKPGTGAFAPLFSPEAEQTTDNVPEEPPVVRKPIPAEPTSKPAHVLTPTQPVKAGVSEEAEATGIKPFVPRGKPLQNLGSKEMLDDLGEPANAQAVSQALTDVLYTEGPIGANRLAKLVADAFGMQRLHPKRREKILALLTSGAQREKTKFGEFIWPEGTTPQDFKVFRTGSIYGPRALVDICDEEFNNALAWVIDTQKPLEEETSEAVARVLDLTPARTEIRERMEAGLRALENANRLIRRNGRLSLK